MSTEVSPQKIGKYEVVGTIGRGGMGTVYKGFDRGIGRTVAIKMMSAVFQEGADLRRRFYQEAQSAGKLQHPNIVTIHDLGEEDGVPFIVMEYLDGESLDQLIAAHRELMLVQKLDIVVQICNALHFAHQHGIVHRDVKPGNVIVLPDGLVKLVDFGIVHTVGGTMTCAGQIVGTLNYMSPEQLNGAAVDARADVFSTGVLLYQLLTYVLPFDAPETGRLIAKILHEPPVPLSAHLQDYPAELDEIIDRSLAKRPDERYASADDFAFDLSRVQTTLKQAMVSDYIEQARASIAKSELGPAYDLLSRALKIDTKHTTAKQLLWEVQRLIARQQVVEKVQNLRQQAERELADKRCSEAMMLVEQALQLDSSDAESLSLRELIQQADSRQQQVRRLVRLAETAQQAGELAMAKKAVDEALQLDVSDDQANVLNNALTRQLAEAAKQKQIRQLLNVAHQEIPAKNFTAAYETIRQIEALDPAHPEVQSLKDLATLGYKQELRRREVQALCTEIETLFAAGELTAACEKADQACRRYSDEPALIQLKAVAESKRDAAEKERVIEEQIGAANRLIEEGKPGEALKVLQRVSQRFGGESRLQSLLETVRERVQQEKAEQVKRACLEKARAEMARSDFEAAQLTLESGCAQLPEDAEIADLLQEARGKAARLARDRKVELASRRGQQLLEEREFHRAVTLLERAQAEFADYRLDVLLQQARAEADQFDAAVNSAAQHAQKLLQEGKTNEALGFLLSQPPAYMRVAAFFDLCELAHRQHERSIAALKSSVEVQAQPPAAPEAPPVLVQDGAVAAAAPEAAPITAASTGVPTSATQMLHLGVSSRVMPAEADERPQVPEPEPVVAAPVEQPRALPIPAWARSKTLLAVTAGLAVILVVALFAIVHARSKRSALSAVAPSFIEITAQPWAVVKSVTAGDGSTVVVNEATPVRLELAPGEHTLRLAGPNGEEHSERVSSRAESATRYHYTFEVVDARKIVSSY